MSDSLPTTPEEYRAWWAENTDVAYYTCWCGCGQLTTISKQNNKNRGWVLGEPMRYIPGHQNLKDTAILTTEYQQWWTQMYPDIPFGRCICGCGQATEIADRSRPSRMQVIGQPKRHIEGHRRRKTSHNYVVDEQTGCWLWHGAHDEKGYAMIGGTRAHLNYYRRFVGPIPDGLEIDHLCQVRRCVNPSHLRLVSHTENMRRAKNTKLTLEKARRIRALRVEGHSASEIGEMFGVSRDMVYRICRGEYWKESPE